MQKKIYTTPAMEVTCVTVERTILGESNPFNYGGGGHGEG